MKKATIKTEDMSIHDLHLNDDNTNVHPRESIDAIKRSIEEFGFKNPLMIDEHNIVQCGNGRLQALQELEFDTVSCVRMDDLTPEQIKAFAIADNATQEHSFFDMDLVKEAVHELSDYDFTIESLCLTDEMLAQICMTDEGVEVDQGDMDDDGFERITIECKSDDRNNIETFIETALHEKGFVNVKIS